MNDKKAAKLYEAMVNAAYDYKKEIIKEMANETTSKIKVSELCNEIYWKLASMDIKCAIVNDRAIEVDGDTIWFQRNNKENCWKTFEVIDCEYIYI